MRIRHGFPQASGVGSPQESNAGIQSAERRDDSSRRWQLSRSKGVSVIDASTRAVTATVPVGTGGVAVDPGSHTVYVTNSEDRTVSVIESR